MKLRQIAGRIVAAALICTAARYAAAHDYVVGLGRGDTTAVAMGETSNAWAVAPGFNGLQSRLTARAFLIKDAEAKPAASEVLFVVVEAGLPGSTVKDVVLQELAGKQQFNSRFSAENLVMVVTHTHGAPPNGDAARPKLFKAQIDGIVQAIVNADNNKVTAAIKVSRGNLTTVSRNRSIEAFKLDNVNDIKAVGEAGIDPLMTQLTFVRGGIPVGALTFFGTHATNMVDDGFTYVTGDSYGYAARRLEDRMNLGRQNGGQGFVAAFAETNPGDVTSNKNFDICTDRQRLDHHQTGCKRGVKDTPFDSMKEIGERLYDRAYMLLTATGSVADPANPSYPKVISAAAPVDDGLAPARQGLNYRYQSVALHNILVDGKYTRGMGPNGSDPGAQRTCAPAWGAAFAAGSTEDLGTPLAAEGADNSLSLAALVGYGLQVPILSDILKFLASAALHLDAQVATLTPELRACQGPKDVIAALPATLTEMHVLKLGSLYLAVAPFELPVMTGYRIRKALAATLGVDDMKNVLALGYLYGQSPSLEAGGFAGYLVTPEEYESKQYESGYTDWGKWSQPAVTQALDMLASGLKDNSAPPARAPVAQPAADDPLTALVTAANTPEENMPAPVAWDGIPLFRTIGSVLTAPAMQYEAPFNSGQGKRLLVSAEFVSGHPMNRLRRNDTFLVIEKQTADGRWEEYRRDDKWGAKIQWNPTGFLCINCRSATVTWEVEQGNPGGTYRIVHKGNYKPFWALPDVVEFRSETAPFVVAPQPGNATG
ncbi:MAG: neutral/alkaline non-lysosomal ceramidase family protein [Collimonas fungivorans]|uniref:neutral/alkaline non-lysosomal ceramidase N-terminal domain-containing protein n=1 Tax=Collimonas fungivorans TaxID=158899 RepID=UPI0026ECA58E|nr:neutral/alkaline non-lysosomal ceramidase N-terminal domain-containing protein [Collimonas fungivorans]MDB5769560.1 neutral/alkaline non-lysosomal ceramidase family protein [Collimonas fungivorans]